MISFSGKQKVSLLSCHVRFHNLGLLPPIIHTMALTATATRTSYKAIHCTLGTKNAVLVAQSPNKPNNNLIHNTVSPPSQVFTNERSVFPGRLQLNALSVFRHWRYSTDLV